MKVRGVHHVGIAVRNLEASLKRWSILFSVEASPIEEMPDRGVRLAFLRFAQGPEVELVAPLGPASPVSRFLESEGEGVQHLTLEVDDIEEAMGELKRAGLQLLSDEAQRGADGALVAFIHPRSLNGVLVEIRQARLPGEGKT